MYWPFSICNSNASLDKESEKVPPIVDKNGQEINKVLYSL